MKKVRNLREKQTISVQVSHPELGDLGTGELTFGANTWAHVSIDDYRLGGKLGEGAKWPLSRATTKDGQEFTLFDCTSSRMSFYADVVAVGELASADFKRLDIRYSEISEWFAAFQRIEGKVGDTLTWNGRPKTFSVALPNQDLTIRNILVGGVERKGEDHIVHEHMEIVVEKTSGTFSLQEAQRCVLDISCLLSILIAHPVSLVSAEVQNEKGEFCQLCYTGFKPVEKTLSDDGYMTRSFIREAAISDRWQLIFESYFNSKYRNLIWTRLSGMQRYDGFWEYHLLGYTSLLDQYVSLLAGKSKKASARNLDKMAKLEKAIDKVSPAVSAKQKKQLVEGVSAVLCKGPRELTFADKFQRALQGTDPDVVKIIDLSPDQFQRIKDVRDAVAHGDDPNLPGNDFTWMTTTIAKIELLLTYWAFCDFGLTRDDFFECLYGSHSRLCLVSRYDRIHLARAGKFGEFFTVSSAQLLKLKTFRRVHFYPCLVRGSDSSLELSESLSTKYWDISQTRIGVVNKPANILGLDADAVTEVAHGYVECPPEVIDIGFMFIVDGAKIPARLHAD